MIYVFLESLSQPAFNGKLTFNWLSPNTPTKNNAFKHYNLINYSATGQTSLQLTWELCSSGMLGSIDW